MTVNYAGSLTLGAALPMTLQAQGAIDVTVGASLPRIQAEIAGAIEAQARLTLTPPSLVASLQTAQQLVASIQAAIALGGALPGVDFQLTALAGLLATLNAQLASLTAQASISAGLGIALGSAGAHLYTFDGTASELGPQLASTLGSGPPGSSAGDPTYAVLLASTLPSTQAQMRLLFRS